MEANELVKKVLNSFKNGGGVFPLSLMSGKVRTENSGTEFGLVDSLNKVGIDRPKGTLFRLPFRSQMSITAFLFFVKTVRQLTVITIGIATRQQIRLLH